MCSNGSSSGGGEEVAVTVAVTVIAVTVTVIAVTVIAVTVIAVKVVVAVMGREVPAALESMDLPSPWPLLLPWRPLPQPGGMG